MNFPNDTFSFRSRRWLGAGLLALAFGSLSAAGLSYAENNAPPPSHEGMMGMHHGPMTPEQMQKHADRMIARLVPDATPEQKQKLETIAKAAMADLKPLREKGRELHKEMVKLLSQPTIDRTALEQNRQARLQLDDQVSKRTTQAFADAAAVLTPAQRAKLPETLARRHGRGRH